MTQIHPVDRVDLTVSGQTPPFQAAHARDIDAYWSEQSAKNVKLFDGPIFFAAMPPRVSDGALTASAQPARFATMLYWRDHGWPDATLGHLFAAAILRTADGAFILAEMAAHTANAGLIYFPGGLFDRADIVAGRLDAEVAVRRELTEETGLDAASVTLQPGFLAILMEHGLGAAKLVDLPWPGEIAKTRVWEAVQRRGDGEVAALHLVRAPGEIAGLAHLRPYAKDVMEWLFQRR